MIVLTAARDDDWIEELAFAADGGSVAGSGFNGVYWWELPTGQATAFSREFTHHAAAVAVASDGRHILFRDSLGVHVGDTRTGSDGIRWSFASNQRVLLSPSIVVQVEWHGVNDMTMTGWEWDQGDRPAWVDRLTRQVERVLHPPAADWFVSTELTAVPMSQRRGKSSERRAVVRRLLADGRVIDQLPLADGFREGVGERVHPDGRTFAGVGGGNLYVAAADAPLQVIESGSSLAVTGVAFHPSGRYLAATSNDETVKIYDTATWKPVRTFTWDIGRMRSIAFSADGTLAAAGSDTGKVVVWDFDG